MHLRYDVETRDSTMAEMLDQILAPARFDWFFFDGFFWLSGLWLRGCWRGIVGFDNLNLVDCTTFTLQQLRCGESFEAICVAISWIHQNSVRSPVFNTAELTFGKQ